MLTHLLKKKKILFSKMHGLGNDFIIINCIKKKIVLSSFLIKKLSNRYTGIGFDQLLIIEKSNNVHFDFHYRIFNANGNEVEQCGNGARCFGLFIKINKLTLKKSINVSTKTRNLSIFYMSNNLIKVNMDHPIFIKNQKFLLKTSIYNQFYINLSLFFPHEYLKCSIVSMGNPHCIIQVQCIKYAPVNQIGKILTKNIAFPEGINVSFMQIINKDYIKLRVYERDVGETQACGSGACAAVAIGIMQKKLSKKVQVELLGGTLLIEWKGVGYPLYMIGPAEHVYDGFIYIK